MPLEPVKVDISSTFNAVGTQAAVVGMERVGVAARKTAEDTALVGKADREAASAVERFVQKLREEADTLGMTSLQMKAYAASKKNFTDAQALSVSQSLTAIKAHEEEQARVERISTALGVAGKAFAAFAAAQAAAKIASVKSVLTEADDLNKESQALGVAVEWLSKFRYAGDLANVSADQLRMGMRNLAKQIEEAESGTGNGRRLFESMGVSVVDVTGKVRSLDSLLPELADRFSAYADGPRKTALALELFGRDGLRWIPLLNQGAQGLRDNAQEAERLGIVIGGDLAAKSEAFRDNVTRLEAALRGMKVEIASGVLPFLSRMIGEMNEGIKIAGGFMSALRLFGTMNPFNSPGENINSINAAIQEKNDARARFIAQGRDGWVSRIDDELNALQKQKAMAQFQQRQLALGGMTPGMRDEASRFDARESAPVIPKAARSGGGGGGGGDPFAAASNYILALQNQLDAASGEASAFDRTVREITEGTKKWTDELAANALAIAGEIDNVKAAKQALDAYLKTLGIDMEVKREIADLNRKRSDAIGKANVQAYEEAERIKFETQLLRLNGVEREKVIALRKMQNERPAGLEDTEFNRNVDAVQAAIDAKGKVQEAIDERRRIQDDVRRLTEDTSRSITDAIITGGRSGFRNLGQIAIRTFQNLVLRPLIEPQIKVAAGETVNWVQGLARLFGGSGLDMSAITAGSHSQNLSYAVGAFPQEHSGYGPGDPYGPTRMVSPALFARAPRFHSGIGPHERPAIIRKDESVLTPGQMRQLAPVGAQPMRVEIVNSGAPKEVQSATPRIDVDGTVVRVVLADMARNGPIAQGLSNTYNLRR